ncbi:hypothetical protein IWW57_002661, partial [Coemansia sp. S610]
MAKRGGDTIVESESSERKRLRNEVSVSVEWITPRVSEDRRCADAVASLLQENQFEPDPRCMDVAVHLVQGLKQLQLLNTPYARQSFEDLYSSVLDYVGKVIDHIKQVRFVMFWLLSCVLQVAVDRDLGLLTLPLEAEHRRAKGVSGSTGLLLSPAAPLISSSAGSTCLSIFLPSATSSLVATILTESVYSTKYAPWLLSVYAWSLSKAAALEMRLAAWSILPIFCHHMERQGKDGYAAVLGSVRVTVDDPPQLVEVVSSTVGYLACARAGCLRLKPVGSGGAPGPASIVAGLLQGVSVRGRPSSDSQSSAASAGRPIYCAVCDYSAGEQAGNSFKSVSLSGWLSYWFIASSRLNEETSIRFLGGACRFVRHAPPEDVGLKASPLGQGTIRRLTSSSREVRLAATDALLAFSQVSSLDSEKTAEIKRANRAETMRTLTRLAQDIQEP